MKVGAFHLTIFSSRGENNFELGAKMAYRYNGHIDVQMDGQPFPKLAWRTEQFSINIKVLNVPHKRYRRPSREMDRRSLAHLQVNKCSNRSMEVKLSVLLNKL